MSAPDSAAPASPAAVVMEQFFTRQRANDGVELPFTLPDGTSTKHSLRIRGVDSDVFRLAEAESQRRILEASHEFVNNKSKMAQTMADERTRVVASLIISWSFDRPLTTESAVAFLKEAPQIAEQIDQLATRRRLFFRLGSVNSSPSPAPSSS
jgi:hypothetical protein